VIFHSFLFRVKKFSDKRCRENRKTYFVCLRILFKYTLQSKNTVVLKFMLLAKCIQLNVSMYSGWEHDQRLYCMEFVWEISNNLVVLYSIYSYRERSYCAILSFFYRNEATFIHNECHPTQNSSRSVMPIFRQELEEKLKISVYIPSFR